MTYNRATKVSMQLCQESKPGLFRHKTHDYYSFLVSTSNKRKQKDKMSATRKSHKKCPQLELAAYIITGMCKYIVI